MFFHLFTIFIVILGGVTTHVHGECPWHCICYLMETPYTTNCSGLNLEMFPSEVHSKVQWLDLKNNYIQVIPNLDKYANLQVLELSGNRISKIPILAFRKLKELTYLDLSNNSFTDWSQINLKFVLQSLTSLKTLNLSYNSLKQFNGKDGWSAISSSPLEYVHLKSCSITQVDGKVLLYLKNLKYLDLSSNPIKWLDDLASPTLTYLDISHCDIDSMNPNALRNLPSLTTLKLSGNSQFAINHGNLTSESLQVLEISYCSLNTPGLYGFPNLTYANLRGNKIVTLKDRAFVKNKFLVELDLSSNEIRNVQPLAFIGARQLAFVNLSANALKGYLPWNTFSTNYNLKTLDLSINRLESVGNLSILALENLDLSQCLIKEINKDSLKSLPWLMHLNMSHNPLEKLPDGIHSWYLRVLDLSYCRLSDINNNTFINFPEMVTLNLTGNRFTNIFKTSTFDDNDRLSVIKLGDNPWICDCNSQDFKEFSEYLTHYPQKVSLSDQRDIKCMSPGTLAGKSWVAACYYVWYPIQEPASSFGLSHYGTALLIMVLTVAGIFAVIGAIKHGIRKRLKREEGEIEREREIELGNTYETRSRAYQSRQDFDLQGAESPELRFPRSTARGRTDSQLTQPPTYEEAVEMIRASTEILNASREDVADSRTQSEHDNLDSESDSETGEQYSIGTIDSDSEEEAAKALNANSK